jgi:ABC-2 type transport system permease protein
MVMARMPFMMIMGGAMPQLQSASFAALLPMMVPIFARMPVVQSPPSGFATVLSLIPPFTPLLMMLRMNRPGGVPARQAWLGLANTLALTLFLIWVGGRVFRVSLMTQGTPPKLGNLVRWAVRG